MANYIKNLKEDNNDIIYPITKAGAVLLENGEDLETEISKYVTAENIAETDPITPTITHDMIQEGAVKSNNIDYATFTHTMETVPLVAVGTSFVTLKTITISNSGLYILDIVSTRGSNSASGAIIYLQVQKNGSTIRTSTGPTVANYVGNHEPICNLCCNFEASAGDTITISTRKDRTDYTSNLGCQYALTQVA